MLRNPDLIMTLQAAVGSSLWQCQALEESLVHILLIGNKLDRDAGAALIDEMYRKYGELTLGQLADQIQNIPDVPEVLKKRLMVLKKERNWLAHKSRSDIHPHANSYPPAVLHRYLERIMKIHDDALELNKQFADVLEERVKNSGVTEQYLQEKAHEIYSRWLAG